VVCPLASVCEPTGPRWSQPVVTTAPALGAPCRGVAASFAKPIWRRVTLPPTLLPAGLRFQPLAPSALVLSLAGSRENSSAGILSLLLAL